MDEPSRTLLRPLFPMERALWLTDRAFPTSVVVALHVTPHLDEGACRQALDRLQARHEVLRAGITASGRHPVFFRDAQYRPIELEVRPAGTSWLTVCTERLNGRVPSERAPLLDVVLVPDSASHGSVLVVRLHHSFVDGWVLTHLLGQLLDLIGGTAGEPEGLVDVGAAATPLQFGSLPAGPTLPSTLRRLLFLQFDVAIEDGAPVVTLNGAGSRSAMAGKAPGDDLPDWSFLKNSDGGTVLDFSFENQLVELEGGQQAVRMTYVGPTVPLLRTLRVSRPTTMPPFVAAALGVSGPIRLEPGDYPIDTEGAATINARLLGR